MSLLKENNIKPICAWDDKKDIFFVYRDNEKKKKIFSVKNYEWYFLILSKELEKKQNIEIFDDFYKSHVVTKIEKDKTYSKIFCNRYEYRVYELFDILKNNDIEIFEKDLSLSKRYMIDNNIKIEEDLSILFFDIETDDTNNGIMIGRDRIISWAGIDDKKKIYYSSSKNEKQLLIDLLNLFQKYDLIVGWNSKQFDLPYIQARIEVNNIKGMKNNREVNFNYTDYWKKIIHIDMMQRLIKLFGPMMTVVNLTGFSLNEVSKVFLNETKVERSEKTIELFNTNPEKLKRYNIKDVVLLYDLNEKLRTLPLMIKECAWTGSFLDRFYIGELLDNYILRKANTKNIHLLSRPSFDESEKNKPIRVRGGYVMEPKIGLYENVRVMDYKSMYPSLIVSWNIGQESLVTGEISDIAKKDFNDWLKERKIEEVPFLEWYHFLRKENRKLNLKNEYFQTANNQFFKKDKTSIVADLVKQLLEERKQYKKQQIDSKYNSIEYKNAQASQEAVKEMSNSMYGITADKQSRYFDLRIAEAITLTGQFLNRTSIAIAEKMNYKVIYADTDSFFMIIKGNRKTLEVIKEINDKLIKHLTKEYKFKKSIILIEYEKMFSRFVMVDKKRYSGRLAEIDGKPVDSILSKGIENVRKSTIGYTRRKINELLELLLIKKQDKKQIKKWLRDLKEHVLNKNIEGKDLSITMKLSKPVSSYKSKPPHVRLAEKLIAENKILETHEGKHVWGQKIEYIITDSKNKNEAILLEDFKDVWDRKYYWDVQVYAPIMRILKVIWPKENWEEHSIILFEKLERKKEKEKKKLKNDQEKKKKQQKLKFVKD